MGTWKLSGKPDEMVGDNFVMDWHLIQGGVVILLVTSCYGNWDKLQLDGLLGLGTDLQTIASINTQITQVHSKEFCHGCS